MTLFPRHQGLSNSQEFALRCRAHRLLDRARAGEDVDAETIAWALRCTGDDDGAHGHDVSPMEPQEVTQ